MIEVIANGDFAEAVAERMKGFDKAATLIDACFLVNGTILSEFEGVDVAYDRAQKGEKVVLYCYFREEAMAPQLKDSARLARFTALMNMPNARYMEAPFTLDTFKATVSDMYDSASIGNPAVVAAQENTIFERSMSILRHDLKYVLDGSNRFPDWYDRARALGFSGTDGQIVSAVQSWHRTTAGMLAGQSFDGLFVDVQGTIIREDGTLNTEVMKMIEEAQGSGPVTVWTDGDLKKITEQLRALGVTLPVVSKFDFNGATVERAIDDKSQDEFVSLYGVTARSFLQVE